MQVLNDWQVIKLNQIEVADSVVSSSYVSAAILPSVPHEKQEN